MILQNEIQQVVYKTALFECQDPDPEHRPTYGTQFGLTPTSYTHGGSTELSLYNYPEPSLPATNMGQIRNSPTPINYQTPMSGQSLVWKKQIYIMPQLSVMSNHTVTPDLCWYRGMLSCQSEKLKIDSSGGWSSAGLVT